MPKINGKTKLNVNMSINLSSCKPLDELSILTLKFMLGGMMRYKHYENDNVVFISGRKLTSRLRISSEEAHFLLDECLKKFSTIMLYITTVENGTETVVSTPLIKSYMVESINTDSKKHNKDIFIANVIVPIIVIQYFDTVAGLLLLQLDKLRSKS